MSDGVAPWDIALDRGGTFTDVVARDARGRLVVRKVPTSLAGGGDHDAVIDAIREVVGADRNERISADRVRSLRCGTTAATNALLERRGERCALLVTNGFADLLRIRTQARPDLFALDIRLVAPLADIVHEIPERVMADGTVRTPLDDDAVRAAAQDLVREGVHSACVLFLHSYAYPAHETRAAALLRDAGIAHVTASHEIARQVKAVERGETVAADAYLTPPLRRSLARLQAAFAPDVDVLFAESNGGLVEMTRVSGPRAVLSGPAGGALATARIAERSDVDQAIGFDMGGTSTDVCRWAGSREMRYETRAAGLVLQVPSLRIETVAAGGGSCLAYDGRRLLVGPESVGAVPGPAGYGVGGGASLTDANAVLGRLLPAGFPPCFGPDHDAPFDVSASRRVVAALAERAGLTTEQAAAGFVEVAVERMAHAIREVSVARGHDVRDHALVCFGGAAAQHACALARSLEMERVLVPALGSVLSAWGIAGAARSADAVRPVLAVLDDDSWQRAVSAGESAAEEAVSALAASGLGGAGDAVVSIAVELRECGTDHAVTVRLRDRAETLDSFRAHHVQLFGFEPIGEALEIVHIRAEATSGRSGEGHDEIAVRSALADLPECVPVWFGTGTDVAAKKSQVVDLASLGVGERVAGPAIAVDSHTTVVVEPGWEAQLAESGALELRAVAPLPRRTVDAQRDPVSLALFAHRFMSVAERMGALLERVSRSTSIKERLDFSCAVFDAAGQLVANAPHIPVHLGAMGESVRAIATARGSDLRDGDVFVTNDPFAGGSHLPDITVVTPVMVTDGRPAFFVANRAHHADVGGITPGSMPALSRSIDDEGVRLHDVLLVRDGVLRDDVLRLLSTGAHPARGLEERHADLRAQAAANAAGAQQLQSLATRFGAEVVSAYMAHVLDDGAEAMTEMLEELEGLRGTATETLDDGSEIRVGVAVSDGHAVVDFAGTGARCPGNQNAPRAVTRAAVLFAFRTLIEREVPLNEGCLRPIEIHIPEGSLLDPQPPDAVVGGNVETSMRLVDVVLRALSACAASQGTMNNVAFGRTDGAYYETIGGGAGAGPEFDGASAVQVHMTNTRITDPEILERRWPVLLRRFAVRRGSGGAGVRRGGDGTVREFEFLENLSGSILSERRAGGAPGLDGGSDGARGRTTHVRDGMETALPGRAALDLRAGDVLRIETPGGGGWGPPG